MASITKPADGTFAPWDQPKAFEITDDYAAWDNFWRSFKLDTWVGQGLQTLNILNDQAQQFGRFAPDPNYNALADPDNEGWEEFVRGTTSKPQANYYRIKAQQNTELRRELEVGNANISRFLSAGLDPLTYTPIPIARGLGFIQGTKVSAVPVGASIGLAELGRHELDPTSTEQETAFAIGFGTLLGSAIGGAVGGLTKSGGPGGYGKNAFQRLAERLEKSFELSDGVTANKVPEEDIFENLTKNAESVGVRIVDDVGSTSHTRFDSETGEIKINRQSIADEYNSKKFAARVVERLGARAESLFGNFNSDQIIKWFEANGGELRYLQYMIEREIARQQILSHNPEFNGVIPANKILDSERLINEIALHKIGLNPESMKKVLVPDELLERLQKEIDRESKAKTRLDDQETKVKALENTIDGYKKKNDEAVDNAGGRKTRYQKKINELEEQLKAEKKILSDIDEEIKNIRFDQDIVKTKIKNLEKESDPVMAELERTFGMHNALGYTNQMPWYTLTANKFWKKNPELAKYIAEIAWRLGGSPGLQSVGAKYGIAMPTSAEKAAVQHWGRYRKTYDEILMSYARYLGREDVGRSTMVFDQFKQNIFGRFTPNTWQAPEGKMSFEQFEEAVGSAALNRYQPSGNEFVDAAANSLRELMKHYEVLAKDAGVFQSIEKINRKIKKYEAKLEALYDKKAQGYSVQSKINRVLSDLDDARANLESIKAVDEDTSYFHIMWRYDKVMQNSERLLTKLREEFMNNPVIYIEGKAFDLSTDLAQLEARVQEAYFNITKQAAYNDTLGIVHTMSSEERALKRIQAYNKEIKEKGDTVFIKLTDDNGKITAFATVREVREFQIQAIENDLKRKRTGLGGSSPMLTRKLSINHANFKEFLETNVNTVTQHYISRMSPAIEIAKEFGDIRMTSTIEDLIDRMNRYADESPADRDFILKEQERLVKAINDLRDKVLGVYEIPKNPDSLYVEVLQGARAWSNLSFMGSVTEIATIDVGKIVMTEGFTRTFGGAFKSLLSRVSKGTESAWFKGGKEAEQAGLARNVIFSARVREIANAGGYRNGSRMSRWLNKTSGPFFVLNLLTVWTDMLERFAGTLIQSRMIQDSVHWANGTLPIERQRALAKAGIDEALAKQFAKQWQDAGSHIEESLHLANTDGWADLNLVKKFRTILATEVNNAVITPGAADKPNFMSTEMGKTITQYRTFSVSTTQRVLMSALQAPDKYALTTMLSMVTLAMMVDAHRRPDYINLDIEEQIYRAVEISGITGILMDINSILEVATGNELGLRPLFGFDPVIKDPNWGVRTGSIGGPSVSLLSQLLYAFTDSDAGTDDKAKAIRRLIFLNNYFAFEGMIDTIQEDLVDIIED